MLKTTSPVAGDPGARGLAVEAGAVLEQEVRAHLISPWIVLNSGDSAPPSSSNRAASTLVTTAPAASILCRPELAVLLRARGHGVAGHLDLVPALDQVVNGLRHADVRLDAAHERLAVASPRSKPLARAAEKQVFSIGWIPIQVLAHLGDGGPEARADTARSPRSAARARAPTGPGWRRWPRPGRSRAPPAGSAPARRRSPGRCGRARARASRHRPDRERALAERDRPGGDRHPHAARESSPGERAVQRPALVARLPHLPLGGEVHQADVGGSALGDARDAPARTARRRRSSARRRDRAPARREPPDRCAPRRTPSRGRSRPSARARTAAPSPRARAERGRWRCSPARRTAGRRSAPGGRPRRAAAGSSSCASRACGRPRRCTAGDAGLASAVTCTPAAFARSSTSTVSRAETCWTWMRPSS